MSKQWNDFEHQFWTQLKSKDLEKKDSYILAVSGGLDSVVLLEVMSRLRPQARLKILHYHHGLSKNTEQNEFRNKALALVKHKISNSSLSRILFITESSNLDLDTEEDMRNARWKFLRQQRLEGEPILTAHHLDDWFETTLMKMIRGASLEGVSAFQVWNDEIFRPFLNVSKSDLLSYAKARNLDWIEDPSNGNEEYLRNWLRENWLRDLEAKQPGSYHNLSQSLLRIVTEYKQNSTFELQFSKNTQANGIDRTWFLSLSKQDQLKAIALYLKSEKVHEFTKGQLEEVVKRLDKNQKDLTFELFDRKWVINALQIVLV